MGPYHAFGSMKFIPEIPSSKFLQILNSNPISEYKSEAGYLYKHLVNSIYPQIETELYSIEKPYKQLGFPEHGGVTAFFSQNMNDKDL